MPTHCEIITFSEHFFHRNFVFSLFCAIFFRIWKAKSSSPNRCAFFTRCLPIELPLKTMLARVKIFCRDCQECQYCQDCRDCREKKRFHLFKSLVYKSEKAQNMPVVAGLLFNYHMKHSILRLLSLCFPGFNDFSLQTNLEPHRS